MNCTEAKKIDITVTLRKMGFSPIKETEKEAWYLSPLRLENDPSFKVNKLKNVFYDFGLGIGGNLVDLLSIFFGSVKEALSYLSENKISFSFHQQIPLASNATSAIRVIKTKPIQHFGLIDYLDTRKISIQAARSICEEVHFTLKDKKYFSVGLKNKSDGWELRNKYFKSGSSPKDISISQNGNTSLIVTEGMFDMLSLLTMDNSLSEKSDFLILNSCSFSSKLDDYQDKYATINLYLDRDETGKKITHSLTEKHSNFIDGSVLYTDYVDVNDWWVAKN